jgi:hypothetical protein
MWTRQRCVECGTLYRYTVAEMLIPGDMEKVIEWAITILIPHLARERVVTVIAFPESLHT